MDGCILEIHMYIVLPSVDYRILLPQVMCISINVKLKFSISNQIEQLASS